MSTVHELKCSSEFFDDVKSGRKPFEVRLDDRGFRRDDFLHLREFTWLGEYTREECMVLVTYVLDHEDFPQGVPEGYVTMGIRVLS